MAATPALKLAMADSCFATLPTHFGPRTSSHSLSTFRTKPTSFLRLSCASSSLSFTTFGFSLTKKNIPLVVSLVARTSDWARQEEEEEEAEESDAGEEDIEWKGEKKGFGLLDGEGPEDGFSEWEGENKDGVEGVGEVIAEGDSPVNEEDLEGIGDDAFPEPPEEAKLFVGNLPYDVDSEKLAHLFEKAGIVEVAEVIYSRESGQSRGFGFVNMSSIEEAEKAVEMFHRYDCNGRLLSVNKATPRGSVPERPREFEPSPVRIYVGNLAWQVDDTRLEQVFSKHGKVVNARVVYDRETGRSRGFGFVTMASKSEHEEAIEALDGQTLDGRSIKVNVAEERPRRGSY